MVRQAITLALTNSGWSGSVLLDRSFRENRSVSYLRYFDFSFSIEMRFSLAAYTSNPSLPDADLRTQWETGARAIELVAANGDTIVIPGPTYPGNPGGDSTEPYFWSSSVSVDLGLFSFNHGNETITLYLESGVTSTTDSPWSELVGLLTTDGEWSELDKTLSTDSEWSELVGLLTTDGEWSDLVKLLTINSEWSDLTRTTIDGEWSVVVHTTIDSEWSVVTSRDPPSRDGEWSQVTGGLGPVDVQFLDTPDMPIDLTVIDNSAGVYGVDIPWTGQDNHIHLDQARTRWIARLDKHSGPAPAKDEAEEWAESTDRVVIGDFQYVDVISRRPSQVILGPVVLFDQLLMDVNFANAALWVMARLEVDDLAKGGQAAPGSFTPFHVILQRDASQTAAILFRGSDDLWCVGQMLLQPTPTWEVIITVAGIQDLYAVPFQWNIIDESITLNLTTIVGHAGFILHAVNYLSDGNILFRREWNSPPVLPASSFGPFVITNTDTTLIVDPILNCP